MFTKTSNYSRGAPRKRGAPEPRHVRVLMNRFPCPSCGRSLLWNGVRRSEDKFNVEGKRWYQFAGPVIHCRYCGVRLQPPHEGAITWLLVFLFVNALLIQPFVIGPLREAYGFGVVVCFLVVVLFPVAVLWLRSGYRRWEPPGVHSNSPSKSKLSPRTSYIESPTQSNNEQS